MANTQDTTCFLVQGSCFCGQVTFGAIAPPVLSAYCHCTQCQKLTGEHSYPRYISSQLWVYLACPLVHTMHFVDTDFRWTTTGDPLETALDTYDNPLKPHKRRYRCKTCGVCVGDNQAHRPPVLWDTSDGHRGRVGQMGGIRRKFNETRLIVITSITIYYDILTPTLTCPGVRLVAYS